MEMVGYLAAAVSHGGDGAVQEHGDKKAPLSTAAMRLMTGCCAGAQSTGTARMRNTSVDAAAPALLRPPATGQQGVLHKAGQCISPTGETWRCKAKA